MMEERAKQKLRALFGSAFGYWLEPKGASGWKTDQITY